MIDKKLIKTIHYQPSGQLFCEKCKGTGFGIARTIEDGVESIVARCNNCEIFYTLSCREVPIEPPHACEGCEALGEAGCMLDMTSEDCDIEFTTLKSTAVDEDGTFRCPCGATHNRGAVNGTDVYKCLRCGNVYTVEKRSPDAV